MSNKTNRLIWVDPDTYAKVCRLASEHNTTIADMVRRLVNAYEDKRIVVLDKDTYTILRYYANECGMSESEFIKRLLDLYIGLRALNILRSLSPRSHVKP